METDAHLQSLFYLSSRTPSKGDLPPGSLTHSPHRERCPTFRAPFQPSLKVPSRQAHSRLLNWAPIKRDDHPKYSVLRTRSITNVFWQHRLATYINIVIFRRDIAIVFRQYNYRGLILRHCWLKWMIALQRYSFLFWFLIFMDVTLTGIYDFQGRQPRCVSTVQLQRY
jgi:hypothetical protein